MRIDHIEAAILAGGASRRMGRDKSRVEWDGVPMLERVADALGACFARVRVVVRPGTRPAGNLALIQDTHEQRAPLVGLHAALSACECSAMLVASCDLPRIDPRVVLALVALAPVDSPFDVVAPMGPDGPEPLLAIYRPRLLPEIQQRITAGRLSLRGLLRDVSTLGVPFELLRRLDPELASLHNVNRPEDLPGRSSAR